jgi:hypothetical protein
MNKFQLTDALKSAFEREALKGQRLGLEFALHKAEELRDKAYKDFDPEGEWCRAYRVALTDLINELNSMIQKRKSLIKELEFVLLIEEEDD